MSSQKPAEERGAVARQPAQSPKWRYIYFLLAAFDLVTVCAGLYLNHRIMGIYLASVEVNRVWADRVAAYSHLGELATDVDAPGNDVFDNRDVAKESAEMRAAVVAFDRDLAERRRELHTNLAPVVAAPLFAHLDAIVVAKTEMTNEAERIFQYFREARPDLAGERMATMDHKYANLNAALLELRRVVGKIQEQNFQKQTAAAAELQRFEYVIGLSIVLMVAGATYYGHKIGQQMQTDAEEKQKHFNLLMAAEARTRIILDTAADGIVTFDREGRVESFNKAAERLFGYGPGEAIGADIRAMIPALTACLEPQPGGAAGAAPANVLSGEGTGQRRDGAVFPLELSVTEISIGSVPIYNGIVRDITDRRRAEEALRVAAAAQAANRAKSQFLANVSHEVRTPLSGVLGMTEMLLDTGLTPVQRRLAETVRRSGESLLQIIDEILDFSRIEAGKLKMESIDFNPWDLSEEVTRLMADGAAKKGLELFCHVADDVPHALRGAPSRLRQVLTNLIGNAVKFTDRGEIVVAVTRQELPTTAAAAAGAASGAGATLLRFSVTDTGIGISPPMQERLFNAFTQVDASPTRRYGGTGLGLAISKELVERMGGEIGVRSTLGAGAEFWFTVRLDPPSVPVPAAAPVAAGLSGRRALVVVDNATSRRVLEQHLRLQGMSVQCVEHGRDGVDALRRATRAGQGFALAIVDSSLPDMDGREFGRAVQADPEFAAVRLAMLVPPNPRGEAAGIREAGFLAQIAMPIRQADLLEKIAAIIGASAGPAEHPPTAGGAAALSGVRVLLAEDNPLNQEVTRTMLDSLGCAVCVVDNGARALAALAGSDYDIVLMDRQMPEMDGFDATAEIRARGLLRPRQPPAAAAAVRLPVVGLTASAIKGERENFLNAGMDDYLTKPFRRDALRQMLERWVLDRDEARPGDAAPAAAAITLDRGTLEQLRRNQRPGAPSIVGGLIDSYIADSTQLLEVLGRAVEEPDVVALARAANSLGSGSAFLGARRLAQLCGELERAARAGEAGDLAQGIAHIRREYESVRAAMEAERAAV